MRDVYSKYTDALATVYGAGGAGAADLAPYATAEKLARDKTAVDRFAASGAHLVGASKIAVFRKQFVDLASGVGSVYVCIDVSDTKVEDASGKDVTPSDRPNRQALVVGFVKGPLIQSSDSWTGSGVC